MKSNMGTVDRIFRIIVAVIVAILYFSGQISGLVAVILGVLSGILILTSFVGFCPLYAPFRFSTKKVE